MFWSKWPEGHPGLGQPEAKASGCARSRSPGGAAGAQGRHPGPAPPGSGKHFHMAVLRADSLLLQPPGPGLLARSCFLGF